MSHSNAHIQQLLLVIFCCLNLGITQNIEIFQIYPKALVKRNHAQLLNSPIAMYPF